MTLHKRSKWTLGGLAGSVALILAVWTNADKLQLRQQYGWTAPVRHDADIAAVRASIESKLHAADEETREFRIEWRCSEWAEDLNGLYAQQQAGDGSQQLKDRIAKKRKDMDDIDCEKYEDY